MGSIKDDSLLVLARQYVKRLNVRMNPETCTCRACEANKDPIRRNNPYCCETFFGEDLNFSLFLRLKEPFKRFFYWT